MEFKAKETFKYNFKSLPNKKVWFTSDPHFLP